MALYVKIVFDLMVKVPDLVKAVLCDIVFFLYPKITLILFKAN